MDNENNKRLMLSEETSTQLNNTENSLQNQSGHSRSPDGNAMFSVKVERGIQFFCCARCSYTTPYKGNVKIHWLTHGDIRPFACKVCGQKFIQKAHLVTHFRLHSGERPFKCDLCDKVFAQEAALSYHKRTHSKP